MIRPLRDRVVVARAEVATKTAGGIIIPDAGNAEKPAQGTVLAVGTGYRLGEGDPTPLEVKVGDEVLFGKYTGTEVEYKGETVLVMREEDILGIL